jgi:hypothetical protein
MYGYVGGSTIVRALKIIVLGASVLLLSCDRDKFVNTTVNTVADPFADITYLDDAFYTTNNDSSMHAGPQIFLYRISGDGLYPENKFNLDMNGQGYFAMTNDGQNLYLQSRTFGSVLKCSPVGEIYYNRWFVGPRQWQSCGIGYVPAVDSLCALVRDERALDHYELLYVDKTNPDNWQVKASATIPAFGGTTGAYALKVNGNGLYILGQDTTGMNMFAQTNLRLDSVQLIALNTDSITGFCFKDNSIYYSYLNREIRPLFLPVRSVGVRP